MHEQPLGVHADLTGGVVDGGKQAIKVRIVDHRILQDDGGIVATQLQRHARQAMRGHFHHFLAAADRPRETHLGDIVIVNQRAHVGIRSGNDVQHTRRQQFSDPLHDARGCQRRRQWRLDDDGVTGQQRMWQGGAENGHRPVERHDDGDDAERLIRNRGLDRNRAVDRRQHFRCIDLTGVAQRKLPAQFQHQ